MMKYLEPLVKEKLVLTVVFLNTVLFIALDIDPELPDRYGNWIVWVDYFCVLYFVFELCIKMTLMGIRGYFHDHWNKFDFIIVIGSIPILIEPFIATFAVSWLPIVRVTRILRLARFLRLSRLLRYVQNVPVLQKIRLPVYLILSVVAANTLCHIIDFDNAYVKTLLFFYTPALIFLITWLISRVYSIFHVGLIIPTLQRDSVGLSEAAEAIVGAISQILIWSIGIAICAESAGYSSLSIFAGLGLGGMAIAFAAQDLIANIIGGLMLYFQRPFEIGENISISGNSGKVTKIGLRSVLLEEFNGKHVSIPNKSLISGAIENLTKSRLRKESIVLNLSLDNPAEKLRAATKGISNIGETSRFVFDDYSIRFGEMSNHSHKLIFDYYLDIGALRKSNPEEEVFELANRENSLIYVKIIERFQSDNVNFTLYKSDPDLAKKS